MGRRLESAVRSDGIKISYTYNADGLRTSKTIRNVKFNYLWNGDKLSAQVFGGETMYFRYDGDTPIGFEYYGKEYYYVTNLQGDVIAILNSNGVCVAEYTYDAWGNCTVTRDTEYIAHLNPLRYRGYYYDSDTNLYYLQSRYYDSNTGRFINSDDAAMLLNDVYNLFAYCENAPTIGSDPSGTWYYYVVKPNQVKKYIGRAKNPFYTYNLLAYNNIKHNNKLYASFVKEKSYRKDTNSLSKTTPMIYNQSEKYIKDMKYGNHRLENCGCEIIATYNLMILINKPQKLTSIINEFELNKMYYLYLWSKGYWGTDPDELYKYFKAHKVKYSKTKKISDLKSQLEYKKSGKFIVGYWNSRTIFDGIHTVSAKKLANSNYVTVYNYQGGVKTVTVTSFIERINKKGRFITSYKF